MTYRRVEDGRSEDKHGENERRRLNDLLSLLRPPRQ